MMIVSMNQTLEFCLAEVEGRTLCPPTRSRDVGQREAAARRRVGPGLLCLWINEQFGRGRLALASPDPDVHPLIDQDLLNVESDRVRMHDGVQSNRSSCCAAEPFDNGVRRASRST